MNLCTMIFRVPSSVLSAIGISATLLFLTGCDQFAKQRQKMDEELTLALARVEKAQNNLVINPEVIAARCDTIDRVITYLDSRAKGLLESNPETRSAYSIYKASNAIFKRYITVHDQIMFDADNLLKQHPIVQNSIKEWNGNDSTQVLADIENFHTGATKVYVTSTDIMRDYMGVINQYHKKKAAVLRVYNKLRRLNMES